MFDAGVAEVLLAGVLLVDCTDEETGASAPTALPVTEVTSRLVVAVPLTISPWVDKLATAAGEIGEDEFVELD